jgi:hypothetical protein
MNAPHPAEHIVLNEDEKKYVRQRRVRAATTSATTIGRSKRRRLTFLSRSVLIV